MIEELLAQVRGDRVALLANQASLLMGRPTVEVAREALGARLVTLFAPEHGWSGFGEDATFVPDDVDPSSGLPVHSLYGPRRRPSAELLEGLDTVVVDLQEVGVRCYTYAASLSLLMETAVQTGTRIVIRDRPNLLGERMAGPLLNPSLRSFLAYLDVPFQHGLTLGELARHYDRWQLNGAADLHVVPVPGWRRGTWPSGVFVPPSPGLPSPEAVKLYPGLVLLEGVNLSEGRGTPLPFQVLGAPWLQEYRLARELAALELPGICFRPLTFVPQTGAFAGEACHGVQLHLAKHEVVSSFEAVVRILAWLYQAYDEFRWVDAQEMPWSDSPDAGRIWHEPATGPLVDGLVGSAEVRAAIEGRLQLEECFARWRTEAHSFATRARPDLLYRPEPS